MASTICPRTPWHQPRHSQRVHRQPSSGAPLAARRGPRLSASTAAAPTTVPLQAIPLTPEAFAPFGQVRRRGRAHSTEQEYVRDHSARAHSRHTAASSARSGAHTTTTAHHPLQVIEPTEDGKPFDAADAQLSLDKGTPRCAVGGVRGAPAQLSGAAQQHQPRRAAPRYTLPPPPPPQTHTH
jgi:hypothetical protein